MVGTMYGELKPMEYESESEEEVEEEEVNVAESAAQQGYEERKQKTLIYNPNLPPSLPSFMYFILVNK